MDLADARVTFKDVPTVHVGTTLADGSPHVVPLWFVWLEEAVYVTCRTRSRVHRNLLRDPRVALQFDRGRAWTEQTGATVRSVAEILPAEHPATKRALSVWFEKYRWELSGPGFAAYADQVHEPVLLRVRPDRLTTWIHASARHR